LTSAPFAVTAGAGFNVSFSARVASASLGSGYFTVIFLNGTEISRQEIPFKAGKTAFGATATNAAGEYQFSLAPLGTSQATLEAQYAGDSQHLPAYARSATALRHNVAVVAGERRITRKWSRALHLLQTTANDQLWLHRRRLQHPA
jgi:hypothetical protein